MSNGAGIIKLHVRGKAFQEGHSNLSSVIKILSGYEQSFQYCINQSSRNFTTNDLPRINAQIALKSTKLGTLTAETIIDAIPAVVPMLPQIIDYGWQTYQKAQELIKVASMFFNNHERPIPMQHVENSPGALNLNVNIQGDVTVTPEILRAAIATHKSLNLIAQEVSNRNADMVTIAPENENKIIDINRDNYKLFNLPHRNIVDEEPIELECAIYSLNKHTHNGWLEFMEGKKSRVIPFKIEDGNVVDYAAGLTVNKSTVTATREMQINALGEKSIKKLHLIEIQNHQEPSGSNE